MSKLYQTDPRLPEQYHKTGCNFLAHLGLCQSDVKHYLSALQTESIGDQLKQSGHLTRDLSVHKPTSPYGIFRLVFRYLGFPNRRGEQVGQTREGNVYFWKHVEDYHFDGAIAQCICPGGTPHFVECDRNFRIIYNPHPGIDLFSIQAYFLYKFWDKG